MLYASSGRKYEESKHYSNVNNIFSKHFQKLKLVYINNSSWKQSSYVSICECLYRLNKPGRRMGKQIQEFNLVFVLDQKSVCRIRSFHLFWSFIQSFVHPPIFLFFLFISVYQLINRFIKYLLNPSSQWGYNNRSISLKELTAYTQNEHRIDNYRTLSYFVLITFKIGSWL